jgi:hypothetical protein
MRAAATLGGGSVASGVAGAAGGAAASKGGMLGKALKFGGVAAVAAIALDLLSSDKEGNLWGLTSGIDKWTKGATGINPSNLGESDDKGVPGWKRLLFGKAADPNFDARKHFGIKLGASRGNEGSVWSNGAKPIEGGGALDIVRAIHEEGEKQKPPVTNFNVTVGGITVNGAPGQSPEQIATAVEKQLSSKLGALSRSAYSDGVY